MPMETLLEAPTRREGRFDAWQHQICDTFVPLRARPQSASAFSGTVDAAQLGAVQLARVHADAAVVERTPRLIRQTDPEFYKLALQTGGTAVVEQADRRACLGPGDMTIYDTSRPYRIALSDDFGMVVAMFPRELVRLPQQQMAALTAVRLAGGGGLTALLSPLIRSLADASRAGRTVVETHLGDAVLDLVTAAFAERMALPHDGVPAHRALLARARAHIDRNLSDPDLCTQTVAASQFVSVRLLQKLFEAEGTSVSAVIRERRLERCRRDLVDPSLAQVPLSAVGQRWGLHDAAHFSRSFRAAFGMSPREYRRRHLLAS